MQLLSERSGLSLVLNFTLGAAFLITFPVLSQGRADTFGTGSNQFSLDFTSIGNAGNTADTTGYGAVSYNYQIGTYDVSESQIEDATASGLANVSAGAWIGDQPAANISWYEAAAFVLAQYQQGIPGGL